MASERIRYRRVSTRMWNDRKFLELSAPKPNARDLWVWLICGPLTTPVPGVVLASLNGMADRLQWPPVATRRCWEEIAQREMATADWAHSLVWLPNALEHNPPESPNVVKSWRKYLDEHVPECQLRAELEAATLLFLKTQTKPGGERLGPSFAEAFREAFTEGTPIPFAQSGNREQGTESTPHPPSGEGGRVTRFERQRAEEIRKAIGRCPHDPRHESFEECVGCLIAESRLKLASGMRQVVAS